MNNFRLTRSAMGFAFIAAAFCAWAWAQNVQTTVTTQTTPVPPPAQAGVPVKEAVKTLSMRHEAVLDAAGNIVDETVVKTTPPEPKTEVVDTKTRPAENAMWVPGYWQWDTEKSSYDWVAGTWRRAIPGMTWNAGHWVKVANGYEWFPGYWSGESKAPATTETTTRTVVTRQAPPTPREEERPVAPGTDVVWIPGYWTYDASGYVWVPGRWERPAGPNMIWLPPRWVHTSEGYGILPGHWDYPAEARVYLGSTDRNE